MEKSWSETRVLRNESYRVALIQAIKNARETAKLSQYIFQINHKCGGWAGKVLKALLDASKRGVQVEMVLQYPGKASQVASIHGALETFTRGTDLKVYYFNSRRVMHAKYVVIDREVAFLGSHNLSEKSLSTSENLSVMIFSPRVVEAIEANFKILKDHSIRYGQV